MSTHTTQTVYYPRSLPKLPTFPGPPPLTISGEELAKMVPPTPTISDFAIDFSQPLTSSEEEDEEDLEGTGQPRSRKKSRPQTKKRPTKKKAAPKPPPKVDSTRGRAQKKRAASAQAKKAAVAPRKKGVKKAEA